MTLPFPSAAWVAAYGAAINASQPYRQASTGWTYGPIALVVTPEPQLGIQEAVGIWLELDRGTCRAARIVGLEEAGRAPFVLTAGYDRWKQVIRKQLGPVAGILQRKIALQGSLPIVVRFVRSAEALVDAATTVPTRFLDE